MTPFLTPFRDLRDLEGAKRLGVKISTPVRAARSLKIAKIAKKVLQFHKGQLLSYMKLLDRPIGLAINFEDQAL